jgi:hypothetical protein
MLVAANPAKQKPYSVACNMKRNSNSIYMVVKQLSLSDVGGVLGVSDDVRSMCSELRRLSCHTCNTSTKHIQFVLAENRQ